MINIGDKLYYAFKFYLRYSIKAYVPESCDLWRDGNEKKLSGKSPAIHQQMP